MRCEDRPFRTALPACNILMTSSLLLNPFTPAWVLVLRTREARPSKRPLYHQSSASFSVLVFPSAISHQPDLFPIYRLPLSLPFSLSFPHAGAFPCHQRNRSSGMKRLYRFSFYHPHDLFHCLLCHDGNIHINGGQGRCGIQAYFCFAQA